MRLFPSLSVFVSVRRAPSLPVCGCFLAPVHAYGTMQPQRARRSVPFTRWPSDISQIKDNTACSAAPCTAAILVCTPRLYNKVFECVCVVRRAGAEHLTAGTVAPPAEVIGRCGHAGLAEAEVRKGWQGRRRCPRSVRQKTR